METTATGQVCLNYMAICKRAIGTLQRRGVCEFIERDELIAEGCLALSMAKPEAIDGITTAGAEALAVTIARRAMIDSIRKNEVRERGRVEVRASNGADSDEVSDGDEWDSTVYGKQNLQPINTHPDLWEAMKALPARQYQAVTLVYWGGKTLAEIGMEMGVSLQRVGQIIQTAKRNLRSAIENGNPHTITNVEGERSSAGCPFGQNGNGAGQ
jgi:RNA polymerase sigma factor (sigma-70 family)